MNIAFYGSSLSSRRDAASYFRGLLRALARLGHRITCFEPFAPDPKAPRDFALPSWCRISVYPTTADGLVAATSQAATANVVVLTSDVGLANDALPNALLAAARSTSIKIFWDVDAPTTLSELQNHPEHPLRAALPRLDLVFTLGGGEPVAIAYRELGARECVPVYRALDPETHFPVPPHPRFAADLGFLGNRRSDREARVDRFFFHAARRLPGARFLLGGSGWEPAALPTNVNYVGYVSTATHNVFNTSPRAILNVSCEGSARVGFSPATRVFEAAGAGACLVSDIWQGIEAFLTPNEEVLLARDGDDVAELIMDLTPDHARAIGDRARQRVLHEHTYDRRAEHVDRILSRCAVRARSGGLDAHDGQR